MDERMSEGFDFEVEEDRLRYIKALLLSRLLPGDDGETERLESVLFKLPSGVVNKLVATHLKAAESFKEQRAALLDRLKLIAGLLSETRAQETFGDPGGACAASQPSATQASAELEQAFLRDRVWYSDALGMTTVADRAATPDDMEPKPE